MAFLFEGLALYLMRPMAWIKWLNLRDSEGKHFSAYIAFPLSLAFSTHTLFISFQIHCLLCFFRLVSAVVSYSLFRYIRSHCLME